MGEVEETTLSNVHNPNNFTIVATVEGLSNQSAEMEVTLTTPYTYRGGNLLIGTYVQTASSVWVWTGFNGIEAPANSSRRRYLTYGTGDGAAFLPKTTFTFEPANDCPRPTSLVASNVTAHTVDMTWTISDETYGAQFNLEYKKTTDNEWTRIGLGNTRSFTLTGLDDNSEYQVRIQTVCGNDDEDNSIWKYASNFTTLIACPAPTDLTVTDGSITAYGAAVTWNGTSNSYVVMIGQENTLFDANFENQQIPSNFTNDATYSWTVVANTHSGAYCAKSASGAHGETSALELSVNLTTDMTLTFSAKVSSETDYDEAYFSIDGTAQADLDGISGNGEWIDYSYPLTAGSHTLRWYYTKDGSLSHNDDCFYVDDIVISSVNSWTQYTTSAQTYSIGNLTPHTPYQVKVKGNCGSEGYSVETTPVRFTTLPTCFPPTNVHFAEGPTTHSVTVAWDFEEGELVQIGMFHGYFTDPSEIQTSSLDTPEGSSSATWNNLYADYDYTFAIRKYCSATDQSEVVVMPFHTLETCTTPTNLTVVENSISGHSATITWDVNGENDYWNIEFATDEDFVNVLYVDYEGNPPFTFTQIQSETTYYVRVKANCVPSGNGESHYSNVTSFTTLASCPTPYNLAVNNLTYESATLNWVGFGNSYDLSYRTAGYLDVVGIEEPFATSNFTPTGWARYSGALNNDGTATLSSSYSWGFVTRNFSSIHAYVNLFSQQKLWLVTKSFNVGSNYSLNFDAAYTAYNSTNPPDLTGTDDRFLVLISTDNKEHWTILREWNNAGTGDAVLNDLPVTFQPVDEIDLSAYAGQTAYIAFYVASTVYNASNDLHIDNVAIGHHIAAGEWQTATTATTTYDFSGLVYDTPYEVHVQSDCGSSYGTSDPSEAFTFTTLSPPPCDIAENFAKVSESETHQGATFTWDDDGDDYTVMVGPMHFTSHFNCFFEGETIPDAFTHTGDYGFEKAVFEGSDCAKSVNAGISNSTADMVLQITLPIEATLGFNAKVSSEATYDKAYFSIDGAVQDNLNGISGEGAWYHYDYTLSAGTHTLRWYYVKDNSKNVNDDCFYVSTITIGSYIVDNWTSFEHATSPFTVTGLPSNTEYFAKAIRNCTTGIQSNDSYVAWFKTLPCQPPTGFELVVSPISFLCRWDAQIGDVFQYCVLPEGYPLQESYFGTYELLNEPINGKYETAQSVNSDTDYVFYIRKKCGENDFSETVTLSFHTKLAPITVDEGHPFTDDFEGNLEWNLASESINNHWMQGSDENLDCNGNALFIANAGNYGYHDDASTVYAFRTFYLTPGTYTYRYDWRANGDENYDYLRVVLAQSLNDITATTLYSNFYEAMPWDQWTPIDGGSQLILSNEWSTKAGVVEITNADYYQVAFIWRNNGDTNKPYPAAIDNFSLSKAQVVTNQWEDDFEGSSCGWTLINGDEANQWAWGTDIDMGHALYISNDGGESNDYTINSPSIVYAVKPFVFEEDGYYSFEYTWKNHGEGLFGDTGEPTPFDYLRVVLAPNMAALTPGELPTGMNAYNLPEGWIALDEGHCLSGQDDWIRYYEETYLEAGVYTMVLVWRNDGSGGRNPAVVDDVSIASVSCPKPTGLVVENLTSEVVAFHFDVESGAEYQYCFLEDGATLYESMFNSNTCIAPTYIGYGLLGFHPDTDYEICVRKKCGENEFSQIATVTFHTLHECASLPTGWLPLTESFEDMPSASGNNLPSENNLTDCWDYINTSTGSFNVFPLVYNDPNLAYQGDNFLYFLSAYGNDFDPQDQYAILPPMEDIKQLKLSFYAANILNAPTLSVGVMEGMDASTFTAIQTYTTLSTAYALYTVSFENYTGNGNRIAIKMDAANADNAYPVVCIDDVTVSQNYVVVDAVNDFTDDFEYKLKWELVNGNLTNTWAWGEAAHNSYGGRGLYISNDGGTHNAYDKESSTMVYAYKNFMLQAGIYEFSYDWRAYGEDEYDYLRVALVPADVDLEANTALPTGLGYLSLPQGWIALDGGMQLNLFIEWQTEIHEVEVTESGMYKMVFAWSNDNGAGNNPPAAIDNVSVQLMTCPTPANLAVSNLTSFSADINWTTYPNVDSYTAKFRTARHLDTILTEGFESTIGDWTLRDCVGNTGVVAAGHSGSHSFRFQNSINSPQHLISPELTGTVEGMLLEFYYKNEYPDYSETFQVGFSSTDNATESFTFGDEITAYDTQWHLYSQPIPAGTKYICWKYTSNNRLRLYIDDIALGSEITAGDWVYINNIESGSYTLSNLAPESTYEVQVKSDCSDKWSDAVSFTTAEIQTMEQTLALAAGWNWWAPMAQIPAAQLRTALGDNLPQLKSKNGEVGTNDNLVPGQMYKLQTNTIVENVTLEGVIVPINISIEEGANWIGYTGTTASIATALGNNFTPAEGDKIISQDGGFAIFNGTAWQGTLTQLTHGQGYVYFSKDTEPKALSF